MMSLASCCFVGDFELSHMAISVPPSDVNSKSLHLPLTPQPRSILLYNLI